MTIPLKSSDLPCVTEDRNSTLIAMQAVCEVRLEKAVMSIWHTVGRSKIPCNSDRHSSFFSSASQSCFDNGNAISRVTRIDRHRSATLEACRQSFVISLIGTSQHLDPTPRSVGQD